jgi:MFS family permease
MPSFPVPNAELNLPMAEKSASETAAHRSAHGPGAFAAAAYALLVLIIGTNLPSPLYGMYATEFKFSTLTVTLIVAVYAAVIVPSLLLAGPLADVVGYRQVVLPALLLAIAGSLLFAFAAGTAWLFAARVTQGLAVGTATPALTAALLATVPSARQGRGSLAASALTTGGSGLGPVLAGAVAVGAVLPPRLPFLVETALLGVALLAAVRLPGRQLPRRWRPTVPRVPRGARRRFAVAAAVSFLAWGVAYIVLALAPSYVSDRLHTSSPLIGGATAGLLLICAALIQLALYRWPERRAQTVGLTALAIGLGGLVAAGQLGSVELLLASVCVAGVGQGLAFMGATRQANQVAPANQRASVAAAFWIASYLGGGLPVTCNGLLAVRIGLVPAVNTFAIILAGACVLVLIAVQATIPGNDLSADAASPGAEPGAR